MRTITCKGGPLHNKTYLVPSDEDQIPAEGGLYKVGEKGASWHPETPAAEKAAA